MVLYRLGIAYQTVLVFVDGINFTGINILAHIKKKVF